MTIRTKEAEVPSEFPPARLFLDDIEEIVRILVAATQRRDSRSGEVSRPKVTFTIKDQSCDEVQELPKIARKTTELWILAEGPDFGPSASLSLYKDHRSRLSSFALTEEEQIRLFNKLAPIFKRRNLRLPTFVWSHPAFSIGLAVGSVGGLITVLFVLLILHKHVPLIRAIAIAPFLVAIPVAVFAALHHHSKVIMRHSSEPSALRQELLQKFPLLAISNILTFLLTVLGFYLKHKYWP